MSLSPAIPKSILCVCLGNICRSPTAEEVFRHRLAVAGLHIVVDSAGTSGAHNGKAPDSRSQAHAKQRGYELKNLRSRQVTEQDFINFDLILAMDLANLAHLKAMQESMLAKHATKLASVMLLSEHDPIHAGKPLPDPYYGGEQGFENVLDQCEASVNAWVNHWRALQA